MISLRERRSAPRPLGVDRIDGAFGEEAVVAHLDGTEKQQGQPKINMEAPIRDRNRGRTEAPPPSRRVTRAMTRQGTTVDTQAADDPPLCQVTRATIGQKSVPKSWKDGGVTKRRLKY